MYGPSLINYCLLSIGVYDLSWTMCHLDELNNEIAFIDFRMQTWQEVGGST